MYSKRKVRLNTRLDISGTSIWRDRTSVPNASVSDYTHSVYPSRGPPIRLGRHPSRRHPSGGDHSGTLNPLSRAILQTYTAVKQVDPSVMAYVISGHPRFLRPDIRGGAISLHPSTRLQTSVSGTSGHTHARVTSHVSADTQTICSRHTDSRSTL